MFFLESFIEVSEEEFKEEDEDDSLVMIRDEGSPDKLHKEEEESSSEGPSSPDAASTLEEDKDKGRQTEEKELKEGAQTESSSTPATNEWEHFDAVSKAVTCLNWRAELFNVYENGDDTVCVCCAAG